MSPVMPMSCNWIVLKCPYYHYLDIILTLLRSDLLKLTTIQQPGHWHFRKLDIGIEDNCSYFEDDSASTFTNKIVYKHKQLLKCKKTYLWYLLYPDIFYLTLLNDCDTLKLTNQKYFMHWYAVVCFDVNHNSTTAVAKQSLSSCDIKFYLSD